MTALLIIGLFYVIVPLILIGMIAFKRQPGYVMFAFTVLSFGSVIAFLWASARWELVSIYFRLVIPLLFIIACVSGYKRIQTPARPLKKLELLVGVGINFVLIIFFTGLNWFTFRGYAAPQEVIDLASPFRNGRQVVLHGGASPFINGHFHVKPQNYALDIVGLNPAGRRASSISGGSDLENYTIYGVAVYSPLNGVVAVAVDEYDDQKPPQTDINHLAGNHILIENEGVEVLLAHLKKGTIKVNVGDSVTTNTLLGQVGNTGNTSEPHLHMHVEKDGKPRTILDGVAVPFTINHHFLVRGEIIAN